jgi:ATP-dependent helicase/DNAse subunit B
MQIKTIPFNAAFLPLFAKYIAKKHADNIPDFSSVLIVFPSERNKVYFREYLLKETGREGIIPPNLLTIEQLYGYIFEKMGGIRRNLPEEIERNVFLKEAVQGVKEKNLKDLPAKSWQAGLPFIKFISIGRKLLGLFDELTSWNLTIEEIEKMKHELHFPAQYMDEELPVLKKIHKKYEKILDERGFVDTTSSYLSIAKNFKPEHLKDFEFIYIAGFLAFTFTDALFIKKILTQLPSELILHSDKDKLKDDSLDNIFYHHNKILNLLEADTETIKILSPKPGKKNPVTHVYIQKCRSTLDEVSFIVSTICNISGKYPLHRIGVMLPEESFYLPLTDALEKFNIPYNLSVGIPFTHSTLYTFLRSIYEFINSNFKASQFFILIKNPIIKGIKKEKISFSKLVYKLDSKIRNKNLSRLPRFGGQAYVDSKIKDKETQILIDYIFEVISKLNQNCSFKKYVKNMREIIQELAELNKEFYEKNNKILVELMDKLSTIENAQVPDKLFLKGKDKLKFLINILEGMRFPTSGDFLSGVQVIGTLESRNIDFDCVIIPSCNEGIFPQKSEKDLFLPANLRKEAALPFYKEREALYSYYFHQLITGKQEAYLSYRVEENTELGLRSRWIEKLAEGKDKNFVVKEKKGIDFANIFITGKGKKEKKPFAAEKDDRTLKVLRTFTFSPSLLKIYKQCQYKFYLSYILKLKEPKVLKEEYDASIWGTILHKSLARLYDEVYPEGYTKNIKRKVIENLLRIGEEEFKAAYPNPKGSLHFEWEMNKKRLVNLIDREITHFKEGFKPVKMEKKLTPYTIKTDDKLSIELGGIPDRIDTRNKKFYIIDYKMSKRPSIKTYRIGEDFTEFQLPLYGLIFTKGKTDQIGGLIYYHLDENRQNFLTLDILQKEGSDYIQRFKEKILIPTLKDIFDKKVPFNLTEDFDTCQRCIFIDHCRRRV